MSVYEQLKNKLDLAFDPDEIATRYTVERDRRVRTDYEAQFLSVTRTDGTESKFFAEDPYTPVTAREAEDTDLDFLVVGGGWVGLVTAARLQEAGYGDIRILDGAGDFGGVWYWNRYPGAQCDIQSYVYLPLLEETGYMPRERYARQPEIQEHAQRIGRHFDLYRSARFHTWVREMRWDEGSARWIVTTNRGDTYRPRFALVGTGSASRPRLPGIPGMSDYRGHTFHTSRWDFDYTGGDANGQLDGLRDKRVAVIGTGASAIQVVPHVAAAAEHTYVFQRTPSSVSPRGNAPTDPEWFSSLQPGWQQALHQEFDRVLKDGRPESPILQSETVLTMAMNADRILSQLDPEELTPEVLAEVVDLADHMTMGGARDRVDELVLHREHAEILKPWYGFMCKRPTFNDEYLPAFNRPNVTLIDVADTKGVERITEHGVVAGGVEHQVDCIVFASGFEITSDFEKRMGIPIHGENGESLYDHWREGMRTLHGIMAHGFPNLFVVGGLFTNTLSPNYCAPIDGQVRHVVHVVEELRRRGTRVAQPTEEAEAAFVAAQRADSTPTSMLFGNGPETCTPGYYNQEGAPTEKRRDSRLESFPRGADAYWRMLEEWRSAGELEGLEVRA
jgi:cyclohexanone monooxygenase